MILVGDPRQVTYSTNNSPKNSQYRKSKIIYFFQDKKININRDEESLLVNYRCNQPICNLSNKLFPDFIQTSSGNNQITGHDGIFLVKKQDVNIYLKKYQPFQLRDKNSKNSPINKDYEVMNFGESKGLSFDRVLIYPTQPFLKWLKDNKSNLAETSRSKLYVAITRARYSVGIVIDDAKITIEAIPFWSPS